MKSYQCNSVTNFLAVVDDVNAERNCLQHSLTLPQIKLRIEQLKAEVSTVAIHHVPVSCIFFRQCNESEVPASQMTATLGAADVPDSSADDRCKRCHPGWAQRNCHYLNCKAASSQAHILVLPEFRVGRQSFKA